MMINEKGFTLSEMLVTLSILSILLLVPLITLPKLSSSYQAEFAAKQLKEDLLFAQHVAMSTGKRTFVRLDNRNKKYVIRFSTQDDYFERSFPTEDMTFVGGSLGATDISFRVNGHPSKSGAFILEIKNIRYQFTIYLGKGMISYRKL